MSKCRCLELTADRMDVIICTLIYTFYVVHASIVLTRSVCPRCAPKLSYNALVVEMHLYVFSYMISTKIMLCTWHHCLYCRNQTYLMGEYNYEIFWLTQRQGQVCKKPLPTITSLYFGKGKCNGEQLMISIMCYGHHQHSWIFAMKVWSIHRYQWP